MTLTLTPIPDTGTVVIFIMRFCDSYSNNNYCYFTNSHPELFAVSFQAKAGDGGWVNNYCPESGHPLTLKFYTHNWIILI